MPSSDLTAFVPRDEEQMLALSVAAGRARRRTRRRRIRGTVATGTLAAVIVAVVAVSVSVSGHGTGSAGWTGRTASTGERSRAVSLAAFRDLGTRIPARVTAVPVVAGVVAPAPEIPPALRQQDAAWVPLLEGGLEAFESGVVPSGRAAVLSLGDAKQVVLELGPARVGVESLQGQVMDGSGRLWSASLVSFGPGRGGDLVLVGACVPVGPARGAAVGGQAVRQSCTGVRIEFTSNLLAPSAVVSMFPAGRTVQWVGITSRST